MDNGQSYLYTFTASAPFSARYAGITSELPVAGTSILLRKGILACPADSWAYAPFIPSMASDIGKALTISAADNNRSFMTIEN
jgi:hypothetical protein